MIIIITIIVTLILYVVIRIVPFVVVVKEIRRVNYKDWLHIIITFFKKRAEHDLFLTFMTIEAGLVGWLPQLLKAYAEVVYNDTKISLWLDLGQNSEWVSLCIAIVIAIGYYLYLWNSHKNNPEDWRKVAEACLLIDEEYNFVPSRQWFEEQNAKQIKNLDKRYSEERNFPFEDMDFALASLEQKDNFWPLLKDDIYKFKESLQSFVRDFYKESANSDIIQNSKAVIDEISSIDGSVAAYKHLLESVINFMTNFDNFYFDSENYKRHDIQSFKYSIHEKADHLETILSNEWIAFKEHHTIIITGEAGTGKSHLIGDIVTHRKRNKKPSILLLGQHFTNASDPLSQIKELLDVKCKKERLLSQLNNYGVRVNEPVVIFIDALNENAGEELWKNFLTDLINEVESFDYLRLVVSFRISQRKNWFYDLSHNSDYAVYHHKGFEGHEREACEYMFSSFGIGQPAWPVYGKEFSNPLFLIKYCRNHERKHRPMFFTDFWETIQEYCEDTNHELAQKFGYNDSQNLVIKALSSIAELMVLAQGRWNIDFQSVMIRLSQDAQYTKSPNEFMDLLIDEGLLRTETYNGDIYVNYSFERIGDYFIAEYLINNCQSKDWLNYQWGDLTEALSVLVPRLKNKELFEVVEAEQKEEAFRGFIDSATWRDDFTEKGKECIARLKELKKYDILFDIILSLPYRMDKSSNGLALYDALWNLSLAERDAVWTVNISYSWSQKGEKLYNLAKWGCEASSESIKSISNDSANACAETLIWSLTTTWRELRDLSTHAIVNILTWHSDLIIPLLEMYHNVNDPYIQERLWCAVYGALLIKQDKEVSQRIAQWTYNNVFCKKCVPEHILVRDYARNVVEYGIQMGLVCKIDESLLNIPFTDGSLPDDIPSNEEITSRYERDWETIPENERDVYWAQHDILASMAPEYGVRAYGDFGRYVFQANLNDFGEDVEMLSNWAIHMIFEEFGYDPNIFVHFDRNNNSRGRSHSKVERIGKKYQWIAMYRIMARMTDRYPDKDWSEEWHDPIKSARNIDPTIYPGRKSLNHQSKFNLPTFDISMPKDNKKWLKSWKYMPKIKDYILVTDEKGIEWVNLFSYNNIIYEPDGDDTLVRDLWTFIQAYIVDRTNLKTVCNELYEIGIQGRSFHENNEIYNVFTREYYWSHVYKETVCDKYYKKIPFSVGHKEYDNIIVEPAYLQYTLSTDDDVSGGDGASMLMPNEWLYNGLHLIFSYEDGVWVDHKGEIAVLDNYMFSGGHSALLVRKDILLNYLNATGKVMFWPILTERMIRTKRMGYANHQQNGGWAYMDEQGTIHQKFRCYEPSNFQKKCESYKTILKKKSDKYLLWLHKHHLIRLSQKTIIKLYYGDDYLM